MLLYYAKIWLATARYSITRTLMFRAIPPFPFLPSTPRGAQQRDRPFVPPSPTADGATPRALHRTRQETRIR